MQLLISVVGVAEVGAAVSGGADIVDVKNPHEGSLGAAAPHVVRAVRAAAPVALSLIHISEPTRLLSISYAVFCLKQKT